MSKKNKKQDEFIQRQQSDYTKPEEFKILKKKTIKELIAPSGIDSSNIDHLEIISNVTRYARSFLYQAYQECVLSQNYLEICTCLEI